MVLDVISSDIIPECLKQHGKGQCFFRLDGLQFEDQRAKLRRVYLAAHLETIKEHADLIEQAAITPGMTKPEVTAAWGLLEPDTRLVFGHVTDDGGAVYAYFTGFAVGKSYALYFKDDVVVGVKETDELVLPHGQELAMRLEEEYRGLFYFHEVGNRLEGTDVDYDHSDWSQFFSNPVRKEIVSPLSRSIIEQQVKAKRAYAEYLAALQRSETENVSVAECAAAALKVLPYPPAPGPADEQEMVAQPFPPRAPTVMPPEEWFWHIASGNQRQVAFRNVDGGLERLNVDWIKGRMFRVMQVPLLVNEVSQFDRIEAEWVDSDVIPRFKQVLRNEGYRTVRAFVGPGFESMLTDLIEQHLKVTYFGRYRYETDVLAFTIPESKLGEEVARSLRICARWFHTDTLTQD